MKNTRVTVVVLVTILVSFMNEASRNTRQVRATSFNVACSVAALKQAIIDANNAAGPDDISLEPGCTYTLTEVDNSDFQGPNGLPTVADDLVVEGNGATIERSSAGGTPEFRLLNSQDADLTVRNITMRNGYVSAETGRGGAIRATVGLLIENSFFEGNHSQGNVDSQAGAVFCSNALTITGSHFTNNSTSATLGASQGGAAYSFGPMSVIESTFESNTAMAPVALGGGVGSSSTLTIGQSKFHLNEATGQSGSGGGAASQLVMTLSNSLFSQNEATGTVNQGLGGGARSSTILFVTGTTFDQNTATGMTGSQGGGSYSFEDSQIVRSTYSNNLADASTGAGEGGGAYAIGAVTATNSTFSANTADGPGVVSAGGGVFAVTGAFLYNTTLAMNAATGSANARGGGVFSVTGATVNNSIIVGSTGEDCRAFNGVTASGNNIDSDDTCGIALTTADAGLLPLALNGPGPTKTHALAANSPALNLGQQCEAVDQRSVARPQGGGCDVGAFESGQVDLVFDVDCDGDEDAVDGLAILNMLAGSASQPQPQAPCDADVDNDLDVDTADAVLLLRYLSGLTTANN